MGDEHSLVVNMLLVASTGRMGSKVADLASVGECQHRLARDFERYATTVAAFIRLAIDPHHAPPLDQTNPLSMNPNFLDRLLRRGGAHGHRETRTRGQVEMDTGQLIIVAVAVVAVIVLVAYSYRREIALKFKGLGFEFGLGARGGTMEPLSARNVTIGRRVA
jgi:hypothetical protein